jgi:hypothetical protein
VALYEALAEQTLRRFGGLWNPGETIFQFRPGSEVSPELISETTRFWSSLVRG